MVRTRARGRRAHAPGIARACSRSSRRPSPRPAAPGSGRPTPGRPRRRRHPAATTRGVTVAPASAGASPPVGRPPPKRQQRHAQQQQVLHGERADVRSDRQEHHGESHRRDADAEQHHRARVPEASRASRAATGETGERVSARPDRGEPEDAAHEHHGVAPSGVINAVRPDADRRRTRLRRCAASASTEDGSDTSTRTIGSSAESISRRGAQAYCAW